MPRSTRRLLLLAAALWLLPAPPAGSTEDAAEGDVRLRWAFGAVAPDASRPAAIQRDTELRTGSRLKFLIEPLSDCSVYLVYQDAAGAINVLYPETFERAVAGDRTYIPPGPQWFELDDQVGLETFFLLASDAPLSELERQLTGYQAAAPEARPELAKGVIDEIRRLVRAHRNFARPVERPVIIGGQTRGGVATGAPAESIDQIAVEINAERFYNKTITIEHQE